jgi:hypothetical protein
MYGHSGAREIQCDHLIERVARESNRERLNGLVEPVYLQPGIAQHDKVVLIRFLDCIGKCGLSLVSFDRPRGRDLFGGATARLPFEALSGNPRYIAFRTEAEMKSTQGSTPGTAL